MTRFHATAEGNTQFTSEEELEADQREAEWVAQAKKRELQKVLDTRASQYPPMEDYLDAVVKGDAVQQQNYINACLAVKAANPKPI